MKWLSLLITLGVFAYLLTKGADMAIQARPTLTQAVEIQQKSREMQAAMADVEKESYGSNLEGEKTTVLPEPIIKETPSYESSYAQKHFSASQQTSVLSNHDQECRGWLSSYRLEPSAEKKDYLVKNCHFQD